MQSLIRKFVRITLLTAILSLTQCQNEEIGLDKELRITSEKVKFSDILKQASNPILKDYLIDLQSSLEFQKPQKNQEEAFFNKIIKENQYDTYTLALNRFSITEPYFKFFVIKRIGNTEKAGIVKYIPSKINPVLEVKRFTGIIEMYDISNNLYAKTNFNNGIAIALPTNKVDKAQQCTNNISVIAHSCTNGGNHAPGQSCTGAASDAYYEVIVTLVCHTVNSLTPPDVFMGGQNSIGGGGSILSPEEIKLYDFLATLTQEESQIVDLNPEIIDYLIQNDFSEQSKQFAIKKLINPKLIEKQIDDSALPPCAKAIVAKIKNSQQNDFAAIIAKLGGANSIYKVKLSVNANLPVDVLALTKPVVGTNLLEHDIFINPNYLNSATQLSIASTIIHELVHSYFISIANDSLLNNQYTFPYLWNYYVNNSAGNLNLAEHNQMAADYVNIIASAIQEFDTGVAVANNSQIQQIYKDLAWGGLDDTIPYQTPNAVGGMLSNADKTRITAVNSANNFNIPIVDTTTNQTIQPHGQPCN